MAFGRECIPAQKGSKVSSEQSVITWNKFMSHPKDESPLISLELEICPHREKEHSTVSDLGFGVHLRVNAVIGRKNFRRFPGQEKRFSGHRTPKTVEDSEQSTEYIFSHIYISTHKMTLTE
jgi:hypothetical protein